MFMLNYGDNRTFDSWRETQGHDLNGIIKRYL